MPSYAISRLRTLRVELERQSERTWAVAAAALREAQAAEARLAAEAARAARALAAARASVPVEGPPPARAAEAQMTRRHWARLAEVVAAAERDLAAHRSGWLAEAARADAEAREAHRRARRHREVLDELLARRAAIARRAADRRAEAANDDRLSRR
jgi:hypothetical protein